MDAAMIRSSKFWLPLPGIDASFDNVLNLNLKRDWEGAANWRYLVDAGKLTKQEVEQSWHDDPWHCQSEAGLGKDNDDLLNDVVLQLECSEVFQYIN